jgi:hypothetical protein
MELRDVGRTLVLARVAVLTSLNVLRHLCVHDWVTAGVVRSQGYGTRMLEVMA